MESLRSEEIQNGIIQVLSVEPHFYISEENPYEKEIEYNRILLRLCSAKRFTAQRVFDFYEKCIDMENCSLYINEDEWTDEIIIHAAYHYWDENARGAVYRNDPPLKDMDL